MIEKLKPYPAYREAEGGWLGAIPSHWMTRRMKYVVREMDSRSRTGQETLLRVSQYTGVTRREGAEGLEGADTRADSLVGYKLVEPDDLVINIMLAWNGSMGVSRYAGIASPAYCVYRFSHEANPWFFHNLLRSPVYKARIKASSAGVVESRLRLYSDDLGRIEALVPPPDEQAAIVRFLDWANGRLDRAIRAKRKVIALLNEQKQAIIHRAVTRGLDPSVPVKPSGIPWLGDIPEHWEVRRLGHSVRLQTGFPFSSTRFVQGEGGIRLLRGINVTPTGIRWDEAVRWKRESGDGLDEFRLEVADIVLGMDRPIIGSGVRAATIRENDTPSLLLQRVARLRPTASLDPMFLLLLLRGRLFRDHVAPIFTGISVPHLSPQQIKGFRVALPTLIEQQDIIKHLEAETSGLDVAGARLEREIELLREYRTRVVADVVTGKLDVRRVAAQLPDEAPLERSGDDSALGDEIELPDEEAAA